MASQQGNTQILAQLGGGWLKCADPQGVFYYNSETNQSSTTPPPQPTAPAQPQAAAQPQAKVKMTLGDWQVCEDAQGEYFVHTPSGQTFDQPPPQFVQLYQAQNAPAAQSQAKVSAPPVQYTAAPSTQPQAKVKTTLGDWQICEDAQGEYYVHTPSGQTFDQPPPQLVQLHQAQAARTAQPQAITSAPPVQYAAPAAAQPKAKVKMALGDWQVCEDAQGEYYVHTPSGQTFEQPPPQLVQLYQAQQAQPQTKASAPPVKHAAAPAAQPQAKVKMALGDWQVCEDAQGEYFVHTPSGQTFDQPPPQLLQLYQAQQAKSNYASQHAAAMPPYAAQQQYAAAPQQYAAGPQHYGAGQCAAAQAGYAPAGGGHRLHY